MKSLITGATGFLGSHLVEELLAAGEEVRVLVRSTSPGLPPRDGVERVPGCLEDPAAIRRAVQGVQRVYHCAARVADHGRWTEFFQVNVLGTQHVVDACLACGVERLIHLSSSDVYGHPDRAVSEDAPVRRRGFAYGDSKIEAEDRVWAAARRHGLPVVVFRPSSIYGPRCQPYVAEIAGLLEQGLMVRIGREPRCAGLTYVTNVTDALRLAATSEHAVGQAYNLHDGLTTTWDEYLDRMAELLGVRPARLRLPYPVAYRTGQLLETIWTNLRLPGRPLLSPLAVAMLGTTQGFATEHVRTHLGWTPRIGLDEGLRRSLDWWNAQRGKRQP